MSKRKDTYILFEKGKKPRTYVNPTDLLSLSEKGILIRKPENRKINAIPMENWQLIGNQVIASTGKANKSITAEVEKYRRTEMEEQIMERKERIKKLEDQFSEMRDCVENLVAEAKQDEARISKIEKKLIDKVKKIRKISAIAIIEGLIIIALIAKEISNI